MLQRKKKKKKSNKKNKKNIFSRISLRFKNVKKAMFEDLEKEEDRSTFSVVEVVFIILVSILFGVVIGYMITYSRNPSHSAKSQDKLSEVVETYENIVDNYEGELDEEKLADAAIKGMISSLDDPYSSYMNKETTDDFNESVDGSFVGIGVVITFEEELNRIIEIYEESPAEAAGLKVDDKIIRVNGEDVKGKTGNDLSKLIRGKEGTKVVVTVLRGEEEIDFTLTRGVIQLKSVYPQVFDDKIGYLQISTFSSNTFDQFEKELKKLEEDGIKSLIIDVRDNHGGQLLQTKEILELFFPKKTVLYQIESKGKKTKYYSSTKDSRSYPIAVLINASSASASEILASCFQDNYKNAILIGSTSYGKGTVQKMQTLSNGTSIKFTTQKWLTSKGKKVEGNGVTPDYIVNMSEVFYENPIPENDAQLQDAISKLKESN